MLIYPISLVNSIADKKMVSTRKKKQQNKRLFGQMSGRDTDFMIGQSTQDQQTENRDDRTCRGTSSDNADNPTETNCPQVGGHRLEENFVSKVRSEVDDVMTSVETTVQNAVLLQ